jgi:glutamine amidotransferase
VSQIAVLDYGIGNLRSAEKALQHAGADAHLTTDPHDVERAAGLVLPGVGHFGRCMSALRSSGLASPALEAVERGTPFLGICVGMQMLFSHSEENPIARGLGIIPGTIRWIPSTVKRPQMQWNVLRMIDPDEPMFARLPAEPWFYFVHSLHGVPDDASTVVGTCDYGDTLNVAFRAGNVFAVQFHPEKSASAGLALLRNFVDGVAAPVGS